MAQSNQRTNFDFNSFNELVGRQPAGLKVFLAESLLNDVDYLFHKFSNPLQEDLNTIQEALTALRAEMKKASARRAQENERQNSSTGSA